MTKEQCEAIISGMMKQIIDIYHDYNPDGKYLNLAYVGGDYWCFNNAYFGEDAERPINISSYIEEGQENETVAG